MTQELRKRFKTSVPNPMLIRMVDVHEQSEDKNDSQMSKFRHSDRTKKIIDELNSMYGNTKDKILELVESLKQDKRKDHEIKKILLTEVKFMSRASIYNALPQDMKREYSKPLPDKINISTPHKVIEQSTEDSIPVIPEPTEHLDRELKRLQEEQLKRLEDEEEPTEAELLKIENEQLKDALKKTQQFKPATALEQLPKVIESAVKEDERAHNWLKNSADGLGSFYFDTYGIELFQNRILSQLKNSGVKVFKRLYFEV